MFSNKIMEIHSDWPESKWIGESGDQTDGGDGFLQEHYLSCQHGEGVREGAISDY